MDIRKVAATASTLALIAGAAFAQDISSLLNQILSFLQQNQQLVQQVVGQVGGVPPACQGITFTRTLKYGMSGNDVKCLQALLNVTPQTGYFGPLTRAAVIKFQEDNADEILAPLGLTSGTGVVGPATRAKLNQMLAQAPQVQIPTQEQAKTIWDLFIEALKKELGIAPTPAEEKPAAEEGELLAEGMAVPTGVTVHEGDQNVAVMAFKVKAKGSDITIDRVDLTFEAGGEQIVYKYINYVALYDGENAIKGVDLNKDTMEKSGTEYSVRLSGLGVKVEKGGEKVITVKVSAVPVYPAGTLPSITVKIDQNGIRGVDTAGIHQYAPKDPAGISKPFNLATAETGSVEASLNANSPKEGVQIVSEDEDTEITLGIFDIKAKKQNVTLDTVAVKLNDDASSIAIRLYDGTTLLGEKTATTATTTFGDLEINIAKDTTKTLTVKLLVQKGANDKAYKVTLVSVSGVDANDNSIPPISSIDAETQHVYTKAPVLSNITVSADAKDLNGQGGAEAIVAKITFSVTAKGGDIWISTSTNDLAVEAQPSSGNATSVTSVILTTSATAGTWGYKVAKDQTVTFTVDATHDPTDAGYWRIAITKLKWATKEDGTGGDTWDGKLIEDLKTGYVYLTAN